MKAPSLSLENLISQIGGSLVKPVEISAYVIVIYTLLLAGAWNIKLYVNMWRGPL
jgi:hypothetical protein